MLTKVQVNSHQELLRVVRDGVDLQMELTFGNTSESPGVQPVNLSIRMVPSPSLWQDLLMRLGALAGIGEVKQVSGSLSISIPSSDTSKV
jgi:hypothetical protein